MADNAKLTRAADNIRVLAASMVEKAKSGHPGGAMGGGADFINVLYTEFLRDDPDDLRYPLPRPFFPRSGPHVADALFDTGAGRLLHDGRSQGVPPVGQPVRRAIPKWTCCAASKIPPARWDRAMPWRWARRSPNASWWPVSASGMAHKTYAYISDGAVQEEISQGVGRIAGHLGLSQPDHVLRLEQHSAFDQGRRGGRPRT